MKEITELIYAIVLLLLVVGGLTTGILLYRSAEFRRAIMSFLRDRKISVGGVVLDPSRLPSAEEIGRAHV